MRRTLVILLTAAALAACGTSEAPTAAPPHDPTTTTTTLPPTPEGKWKAAGITHYRFDYAVSCFCGFGPDSVTVEVRDGKVVSPTATPGRNYATIDELLADAARAEKEADGEVNITYDPITGIPTEADIDWMKMAIDDEIAWSITNFEQLS